MNDIALGKLTNDFEPSASVVCDIFEANPYTTRNQRLEICHKAMQGESVRTEPNNFMDMGNRLEKPIALAANDRIGLIDLQLEITEPVRHRHLCLNGSIDCIGVADNLFIKKDTDKGFYLPEKGEDEGIKINGKGIVEIKATNATVAKAAAISSNITAIANNNSDFPDHANKEKSKFVEAISIPETNIAFITPDLIANKPPSSVKITVVNHPRPFEYNAMFVLVKPISL